MARSAQDSLREQSRRMDCLYNETDRLYNGFARSCGLSECEIGRASCRERV